LGVRSRKGRVGTKSPWQPHPRPRPQGTTRQRPGQRKLNDHRQGKGPGRPKSPAPAPRTHACRGVRSRVQRKGRTYDQDHYPDRSRVAKIGSAASSGLLTAQRWERAAIGSRSHERGTGAPPIERNFRSIPVTLRSFAAWVRWLTVRDVKRYRDSWRTRSTQARDQSSPAKRSRSPICWRPCPMTGRQHDDRRVLKNPQAVVKAITENRRTSMAPQGPDASRDRHRRRRGAALRAKRRKHSASPHRPPPSGPPPSGPAKAAELAAKARARRGDQGRARESPARARESDQGSPRADQEMRDAEAKALPRTSTTSPAPAPGTPGPNPPDWRCGKLSTSGCCSRKSLAAGENEQITWDEGGGVMYPGALDKIARQAEMIASSFRDPASAKFDEEEWERLSQSWERQHRRSGRARAAMGGGILNLLEGKKRLPTRVRVVIAGFGPTKADRTIAGGQCPSEYPRTRFRPHAAGRD